MCNDEALHAESGGFQALLVQGGGVPMVYVQGCVELEVTSEHRKREDSNSLQIARPRIQTVGIAMAAYAT